MTEHIQNRIERFHKIQHRSTKNRQYKADLCVEIQSICQIMRSQHRTSSKLKNREECRNIEVHEEMVKMELSLLCTAK